MPTISTRTNLVLNPSFETSATTGWAGISSSTIAVDNTNGAVSGTQALKVTTPGAIASEGVQYSFANTQSLVPFSFQISVWAPVGAALYFQARFNNGSGASTQNFTGNGAWQTLTINNLPSVASTTSVQILLRTQSTLATSFWVDAAIVEQATATLGYFDGSTPSIGNTSYSWTGAVSASASTATTVAGYLSQDFQNQLWFGTTQQMMSLRLPAAGMTAHQVDYAEDIQYENGGADVYRSSYAYHMEYDFNYGLYEATGSNGLNNFADFASGLYGPPIVFFADPMFFDTNILPPNFAAPALAERGWKSIGGDNLPVTYANTAANTFNQPFRTATFDATTLAANTFVTNGYATAIVPVPPGMTLWLGASGSATGSGVVRVESWMNGAASAASSTNLTLLSATASTRLNTSIPSTSANYVKIGVATTTSGAATVTLTSMMAQLWPIGYTPTLTGNFQSGQGNNGCKFATGAREEKYILRDNQMRNVHYMGLSFTLKEVVR